MSVFLQSIRRFSTTKAYSKSRTVKSGVLCDIDGVLLRGREVLAGAREAIQALYQHHLPVLFLTNQGLQSEKEKAFNLSKHLNLKVKPEQIVLSHSPLRLCPKLHDQFVLALGQQNIKETAFSFGFKNICQIEDIQASYPLLDMVDKKRRYYYRNQHVDLQREKQIPKIEGIVLLGEPIRWESALQLVIDLLISHGDPAVPLSVIPKEHIPVIACNTDLLWMAEAPIPRFGHGAFLFCLESLYKKLTGNTMHYTMVTGKPFLVTFQYAERIIQEYLKNKQYVNSGFLKRIYVIGDNPDTDIYGGNIYKQYIQNCHLNENKLDKLNVNDVTSILVGTGVHSKESSEKKTIHVHKDIMFDPNFRNPDYIVENIEDAVKLIITNET